MRVARQLGLDGPESTLLRLARERWPRWQEDFPALHGCDDPLRLPELFRAWGPVRADEVLQTLAHLASAEHGADDVAAGGLLAWLLIPGAARLAVSLASSGLPSIDELVAAQLWIEVRSWKSGHKVAANILRRTRRGVLTDLGILGGLAADRSTWGRTRLVADLEDHLTDEDHLNHGLERGDESSEGELGRLFRDALDQQIITEDQCLLLLELASVAHEADVRRSGRGYCGLLASEPTSRVGSQRGIARPTVRRRALKAIDQLRAHANSENFLASA